MSTQWSDQVSRDDTLSDEDYHHRELYARFGVTAYMAQVLEHGVVNLLAITELMPKATSQEEYDALVDKMFRSTLGPLVKRLVQHFGRDESLSRDLNDALDKRNYIIHRFWRERIQLTITATGRNRLIDELVGIEELFTSVDKRLDTFLFSLSEQRGAVRREEVEEFMRAERETLIALNGYLPNELPNLGNPRH